MSRDENVVQESAVVILCGGQGSRMKSREHHKVCFPIDGVPAIIRTVRMFYRLGIRKVVIVVGAFAESVIRTVGKEFPQVVFVYQEEQRGTGHAAQIGISAIKQFDHQGPILVTMGDKAIESVVIRQLGENFVRSRSDLVFVSGPKVYHDLVSSAGRVITDRSGAIQGIVEVHEILKSRVMDLIAKTMAKKPRSNFSSDQLLSMAGKYIPDPHKCRSAIQPIITKLPKNKTLNSKEVIRRLGSHPGELTLAGKRVLGEQLEKRSKSVNLSIYLGSAKFWDRLLPRLNDNNAQKDLKALPRVDRLSLFKANSYQTERIPEPATGLQTWIMGSDSRAR